MKLKYIITSVCLLCSLFAIAKEKDKDTLRTAAGSPAIAEMRSFEQLDKALQHNASTYQSYNAAPQFTDAFLATNFPADTASAATRARAQATLDDIETKNHYIDYISPNDLVDLPIGMKKKFGANSAVTIGVEKARFMGAYTQLTVFCKIELPQSSDNGQKRILYFGADNIKLSNNGGLVGDADLALLGDFPISFNNGNMLLLLKGGKDTRTSDPTQNLTYVKLECGGVKEIGLSAEVQFPDNLLVPLTSDFKPMPQGNRVTGAFSTKITDWNDIMAEVSFAPFALKGMEKFAFSIQRAVFDFSDTKNSPDVRFPADYQGLIPGREALWRGVYFQKLVMQLPLEFKQKSGKRVSIEADNFIIDNQGVTGTVAANNVMPMGDASGWKFSVDRFFITLKANALTAAGFNGMIATPLQKNDDDKLDSTSGKAFAYDAIISQDQYLMRVTTKNKLSFDVFQAQAEIDPDSYIELTVKDDKFRPKAVLNGRMGISVSKMDENDKSASPMMQFKGVQFQQLQLQTEAPYLQANYFGYKGDIKLANFPIVLSDINLKAVGNDVALQFTLDVNLMKDKLSAGTTLTIFGTLDQVGADANGKSQSGGGYQYKYKRTQLDMITVEGKFNAFDINGKIRFNRNHPVLGDGFHGELALNLNSLGVKVQAQAAFGSTSFRYWYVDAMATGLKISTGYFTITGLGGGASYHVTKRARDNTDPYSPVKAISPEPDETKGLGFKGVVAFNVGTSVLCAGEVSLEMMFNSNGGLNNMGFYGKANIIPADAIKQKLSGALGGLGDELNSVLKGVYEKVEGVAGGKIAALAEKGLFDQLAKEAFPAELTSMKTADGMISADLGITYDFANKSLHSTFDLYVNMLGVLTGVGQNNRAGWAVMHFDPNEWYIHMGTPTDRLGLKIGIGSVKVATTGYMMAGSRIPGSPPPPKIVADLLGVDAQQLDYMRDMNALGDGRGFAMGMDFSINTGDMSFLMFYASFQAGFGFDIMLKNYGDDYHCKNHPGNIGMNGWFANGQSYAYMQGELGIQVKLMFVRKKISIIKGGGAVLLQATLPNPSWFRGYMGGYFSVLGGLVKGNYRFKIEVGEKCDPVSNNPLDNIKVISDFTPTDKTTDADVFTMPQAVFNFAVNKPFNIDDDIGTHVYRINLNKFTITNKGAIIPGTLRWNDIKTSVAFESSEILPPNTALQATVAVTLEEKKGNSWQPVYDNGRAAVEQKDISFITGGAPMVIPVSNIEYAYPVVNQQYYLPKESGEGYVQLKRGQSYLFSQDIHNLVAQFGEASAGSATMDAPFAYDSINRRINWKLPALTTSGKYTLNFAGIPKTSNTQQTVTTQTENVDTDGNNIQVADNKANGTLTADRPHTYLSYTFESSRYNTFAEKMADKKMRKTMYEILYSDVGALHAEVDPNGEPFDVAELVGTDQTQQKALVQPVASLTDDYYTKTIAPLLYKQYPMQGFNVSRDTSEMGVPPARAVEVTSWYLNNAEAKSNNPLQTSRMPYRYNLPYYYKLDFTSLQYQVVNFYKGTIPQSLLPFVEKGFPVMKTGNYNVQFRYVLPGGKQTSVVGFEYEYK